MVIHDLPPQLLLEIYRDTEFRKEYMDYTTYIETYDIEEQGPEQYEEKCYWRVKLPMNPFASQREYAFQRKQVKVDDIYLLMDESTELEKFPRNNNYVRIEDYNVAMMFREHEGSTQAMVEYLTAVNFQMPLPQFLLNWLASVGIKMYMGKVRDAVKDFKKRKDAKQEKQ